jgi:hypothetical protein
MKERGISAITGKSKKVKSTADIVCEYKIVGFYLPNIATQIKL